MCGISGLLNINRNAREMSADDIEGIYKAIRVQTHRGPDDTGICGVNYHSHTSYSGEKKISSAQRLDGVLGFNRLSIRDLSQAGHQPMLSDDKKVIITFNGEIYNDSEIRNELKKEGYCFKSSSDTEVILASYLKYGFVETVKRLNGMFAIVITDLRTNHIWMARDRFGIKPLYYSFFDNRVGFASELKSIIQYSGFNPELDEDAFYTRLVFSRHGNAVLLKNVELLDPATILSISVDGEKEFIKYYNLDDYVRDEKRYSSLEEAIEATEEVISKAVFRQLVSDVKVGCQLSGGIDSTLVTYFANRQKTNNLNDTVSIVDEKGVIGEEEYIDYVGNTLNLELHKFSMDSDYFMDNYERMIWCNDAPVYQPYFICFYKLAQDAKKYVTVLLSGEGADEVCGGYKRFAAGLLQPFISSIGCAGKIKAYSNYSEYAVMSDQTIVGALSDNWIGRSRFIEEQMKIFDGFEGTNFDKHLKYEISQRLPEALLRQDKMTMAHAIENRVPLLDNEVVDHMMTMPSKYLVRFVDESPMLLPGDPFEWAQGKAVLKELVAKHFSREFAYRKKQIMAIDRRAMVTSDRFKDYFFDVVYKGMRERGIIDAALIKSMFDNVNNISETEYSSLWRAIALETWCQIFLERRYCDA